MEKIKGITFAPFSRENELYTKESRASFDYMTEHTGVNLIILVPPGIQDTAHSEKISYSDAVGFSDKELREMIRYAKRKGIKVALKPTVNCKDGNWRAFISFFEHEVVCEPKWKNWFKSYETFQVHYARIAQEEDCELFIAGCEMVMTEHREEEWRGVIHAIRQVYDGQVTYNTDKYQENHVTWWDCLDIISSSGYYPSGKWEQELDRIENIVTKYQKPFFFAEVGCMSRKDSQYEPNNWELTGEIRLEEQAEWFEEMFTACERRNWISGFGIWEWGPALPKREDAQKDTSYQICKKPAQEVVYNHFTKKERAPFETLTSEKVKVGRFTVVEDRVRVNNHEQPYDYLEIKGGVSIFAVKDGKIIVQQQYRYPIRSWQWELPGGFVDEGESCEEAAIRELKEETGYEAKKVYSLGAFYPSFGSTNEQIHLFAIECGEKGESEREPGELLSVTEMPVEKFKKLIASGQFMHGAGLAAWARYSLMIE